MPIASHCCTAPVVMAGQLGNTMPDPIFGTTVLLTDNHQEGLDQTSAQRTTFISNQQCGAPQ